VSMAGKGGKGLVAGKTTAANKDKDKDKKRPVSRSSRAGIQVTHFPCSSDFVFSLQNCLSFQSLQLNLTRFHEPHVWCMLDLICVLVTVVKVLFPTSCSNLNHKAMTFCCFILILD